MVTEAVVAKVGETVDRGGAPAEEIMIAIAMGAMSTRHRLDDATRPGSTAI